MSKSKFAVAIPEPNGQNTTEVIRALKMSVEILAGLRDGQPATRTFVQDEQPNIVASVGDRWIRIANGIECWWDGTRWRLVG